MDAKEFLTAYRDRYDEIDTADDMVQTLLQRSKTPSPRITDAKVRSSGACVDKFSMYVSQLDAARARLEKLIERQNKEQAIILQAVERLHTAQRRDVIRYRYLMGLRWNEIAEGMFGRMDDYEDRKESYLRRATKTHGAALREMDIILRDLLEPETGETTSPVNAAVE